MFDNKESYSFKEYLRNKDIFRWIKIIIILGYFFIMTIFINGIFKNSSSPFGLVFISGLVFFALKIINSLNKQNINDKKRNYSTWGRGAGAELLVGKKLSELGQDYKIIPDFNTGYGNIDFIVIGPKGIFTIEVKANKGNISCQNNWIYVNNQKVVDDMFKQTKAEMFWLINYLRSKGFNLPITGILEFPYGHIEINSIHGQIDGIWIGGLNFHSYVINRSQNQLSQIQINEIEKVLNNFTITKK